MEFNWFIAIGLYVAAFVLDAVFALYTVAVVKNQALRAASWSLLTYLLYAIGIVNLVENKWYIIPLSLGAFSGAYIIVKREALKNSKKATSKK
jgi:uncharacterized protein YebE (UPF0316 family)